jgi:hypothetical protein
MTQTMLAATPVPLSGSNRWALTALLTLALLFTAFIGLIAALGSGHIAWAFSSRFFPVLAMIHWDQWLSVALWAVLTGALFALSVGPTSATARTRALAVLSGVLVPVGLVLWAKFLRRYWPDTAGPLDQPWLTIALAVYSALAPWLLGRAVRQLGRTGSAPR